MSDKVSGSSQPPALKVFIAEDSLNMQAALGDLVHAVNGATVVGFAASEALAIDWAKSHRGQWDLAIVDLMLQEGDGFSIVRRLKAEPDAGAVVVFSAFVTDVIRRHCETIGADAVFSKTQFRELAAYIEDFSGAAVAS